MLRVNLLRASLFFTAAALSVALLGGPTPASAQETRGSVEQIEAILQSIQPYRPGPASAKGPVHVYGASSMDALAHGWASGFAQFHPLVDIQVYGSNSEEALSQLLKSPSSVAMFSRPVKDAELQELKAKGLKQPVAFPVAREALAVFVHASNPAATISGTQLKSIFTNCEATPVLSWKLLDVPGGWADKPLHVLSRTQNCGTQMFLRDFVFGSVEMREGLSEHSSNTQVLMALKEDPMGIAICGLRTHAQDVKMLQLTAGQNIVPSDDAAVLNGNYPLTRPLSLVVDLGQTDAEAVASQELVRYALSRSGQIQAIRTGFFPVELQLMRAGLAKLGDGQFR